VVGEDGVNIEVEENEEAAFSKRGMGGPPVSTNYGRAMRLRSADTFRNDLPPRHQGRQGRRRRRVTC